MFIKCLNTGMATDIQKTHSNTCNLKRNFMDGCTLKNMKNRNFKPHGTDG